MAVTDTEEPGRAHADCRSMEVEATPEESVVAELGENTAPDGPENDTGSPAEAAPAEVVTVADTADAPAA